MVSQSIANYTYNGTAIGFDFGGDGNYINMTQMAKPYGKRPVDFLRLPSTKTFIEELEKSDVGISHITQKGNFKDKSLQGTWAHELLAIDFAGWLEPRFKLWMMRTIRDILIGPQKQALPPSPHDILRQQFGAVAKKMGKDHLYRFLHIRNVNKDNTRKFLQGKAVSDDHLEALEIWIPYLASVLEAKEGIFNKVLYFLTTYAPMDITQRIYTLDRISVTNGQTKWLDDLYILFDDLREEIAAKDRLT